MAEVAVEVAVFNCRLRLHLNSKYVDMLRKAGIDPREAAMDVVKSYEAEELLYGVHLCPTDCKQVARELEARSIIDKVEVVSEKEPCP